MMYIAKRMLALCLCFLLMMSTALADMPFLMYSHGWDITQTPVEVVLTADVDALLPFDEDRLAMLTPITDKLSLRLVAGENEGMVALSIGEEEAVSLQYCDNFVQLSCMPDITYAADADPMGKLLGDTTEIGGLYDLLHLSPEGESLLTDGKAMLAKIPEVFAERGKRSNTEINISGYAKSTYRIDYTIAESRIEEMQETLLSICNEGWLKEIIRSLVFSGKQTLRVYFTAQDEIVRIEYNGTCGPEGDLRTVKLVGRFRDDEEIQKDYIELTSPAKKGKNKNDLTFERVRETSKKGARVISGTYKYTAAKDGVTSNWIGEFKLNNAYTDSSDVITGEATFQTKLNGAERYDSITFVPDVVIAGTQEEPSVSGNVKVVKKAGTKVADQAVVSIDLYVAEPLFWMESGQVVDLTGMDAVALAEVQQEAAAAIASSLVRPLILTMGKDAQWFFRDLPEDAVQSIIDSAAAHEQ